MSDTDVPRPVARVIRAGEGRPGELRHGRGLMIRLVDEGIGAAAVDFHLNVIRAGTEPGPYHLHTTAENVYHVLEGRVQIRIDGIDHMAGPGDTVFIPPGVPHSAHNAGDGDARLIEIYAPTKPDFVEVPTTSGGN